MNARTSQLRPLAKLLAGWCAVLVYAGVLTPVGPLIAALVGGLDRDHHVCLEAGADGMRVVLHHGKNCLTRHHHGLVARTLTMFAEPPAATDPDHVLQFHASTTASFNKQLVTPKSLQSEPAAVTVPALFVLKLSPESVCSIANLRPPPGVGAQTACRRFTLLLI